MTPLEASLRVQVEELQEQVRLLRADAVRETGLVQFHQFKDALGLTEVGGKILLRLYSGNGASVSAATLFDLLYFGRSDGGPSEGLKIITIYVSKIRKRIGRDTIRNVWGHGYALTPAGIDICKKALAA